jgi:biotin carboxyl carrier protein
LGKRKTAETGTSKSQINKKKRELFVASQQPGIQPILKLFQALPKHSTPSTPSSNTPSAAAAAAAAVMSVSAPMVAMAPIPTVRAACLGRSQISQVATEELSRGSHCGNGL